MTITAAPTVPNPNSATFAADAYPFTQWMAALGPEIDAETARINALGFGAYSATSATSLTVGIGSKSLTIEAGKSFAVGQPVVIANTASPTNYMTGQVTSYNSGTGALVVNATAIGGSGSAASWSVSVSAIVISASDVQEFPVSGTWTKPSNVQNVMVELLGAGGGGGGCGAVGAGYWGGGGGGGGAYVQRIFRADTLPASVSVAIGAGGSAGNNAAGGNGGNTVFTGICTAFGGGLGSQGVSTAGLSGAGGGSISSASGITVGVGDGTQVNSNGLGEYGATPTATVGGAAIYGGAAGASGNGLPGGSSYKGGAAGGHGGIAGNGASGGYGGYGGTSDKMMITHALGGGIGGEGASGGAGAVGAAANGAGGASQIGTSMAGTGGGGGGGSQTGQGGNGGAGGRGCGGGGAGNTQSGTRGIGGVGGDGYARVTSW